MDLGQPERRTHNYIRHCTLDLFAALNVATGEVLTRCTPQHRAQDFVAFLRDIEASVAPALEIHVVLDNLSAHKAPAVHRWLLRHPRVHFHFTLTYASCSFSETNSRRLQNYGGALVAQTPLIDLQMLDPYKPSHAALLRQIGGGIPIWGLVWYPAVSSRRRRRDPGSSRALSRRGGLRAIHFDAVRRPVARRCRREPLLDGCDSPEYL